MFVHKGDSRYAKGPAYACIQSEVTEHLRNCDVIAYQLMKLGMIRGYLRSFSAATIGHQLGSRVLRYLRLIACKIANRNPYNQWPDSIVYT